VPPANKPTPAEARECNGWLKAEFEEYQNLRVILALGRIAHDAILDAFGEPRGAYHFAHAAEHRLADGRWLIDSYHCSRYNTQTRRLTREMFLAVLQRAEALSR
jgi:uracil-DNA glycosylase